MNGTDVEKQRLADPAWRRWGPYVSERAWGTVREDYSPDGEAWTFFPHDHARSRTYRWSEDGLGAICDDQQLLCFAFAFWNGKDPILKERIFGLTGEQANHGEDAKEYWWYLDSTPSHSWMRWRYAYPQAAFPYEDLIEVNGGRSRTEPEYELLDTGVFTHGWWDVEAEYAKADAGDICIRVTVRNAGSEQATLHLLPTLWFRNTWSWDEGTTKPSITSVDAAASGPSTSSSGRSCSPATERLQPLFCDNETNSRRLWSADGPAYPKDGINDHLLTGAATVNPEQTGTKAALHYQLTVAAGDTAEIMLRLAPDARDLGSEHAATRAARADEADAFYGSIAPAATDDERLVMRQAFAGMLWCKQFYHYDVQRWLDGDPTQIPPPASRLHGRNSNWAHVDNRDVISMPDKWEYPWFAAWDLAFHTITLSHVDPEFAKGAAAADHARVVHEPERSAARLRVGLR